VAVVVEVLLVELVEVELVVRLCVEELEVALVEVALPIEVLSPSDEEVGVETCVDVGGCVLMVVDGCEADCMNTSAAKAPATRRSATPAIRATVENLPARPFDFPACIL